MDEIEIDQETALRLYSAAVVGVPHLALELEELGWCDPENSLQRARSFRRDLLGAVEKARRGEKP
jgi:hypothetical protein